MKTGNTACQKVHLLGGRYASMEPGHEDREYLRTSWAANSTFIMPQWSPVMKTGNTPTPTCSAEPPCEPQWSPVMKTGNTRDGGTRRRSAGCLNGARS